MSFFVELPPSQTQPQPPLFWGWPIPNFNLKLSFNLWVNLFLDVSAEAMKGLLRAIYQPDSELGSSSSGVQALCTLLGIVMMYSTAWYRQERVQEKKITERR